MPAASCINVLPVLVPSAFSSQFLRSPSTLAASVVVSTWPCPGTVCAGVVVPVIEPSGP